MLDTRANWEMKNEVRIHTDVAYVENETDAAAKQRLNQEFDPSWTRVDRDSEKSRYYRY